MFSLDIIFIIADHLSMSNYYNPLGYLSCRSMQSIMKIINSNIFYLSNLDVIRQVRVIFKLVLQ